MIEANSVSIKRIMKGLLIALAIIVIPVGVTMAAGCSDSLAELENTVADNDKAIAEANNKAIAGAIDQRIMALGNIDNLTLAKADEVKKIKDDYDKLTAEQKGYVTKLALLYSAEQKISDLSKQQTTPSTSTNTPSPATVQNETTSRTVYTTTTGTKYHLDQCRFLSKSKIPITLEDAKARGLEPCGVCNPGT